ncbi:MAG: alpha/beta hydrolase [Planctomycetaceae bacterium]
MNRLSLLASSDSSPKQPAAKQHSRTFFLPLRYEPGYRYPLIVWLHSDGYNEHQVGHVLPHISTRNYVGVGVRGSLAMDSGGRRFAWTHTPAAIARCEDSIWQAVDEASARYSIHRDRIFLAGYGEGGTMARRIALQRSSHFAGCVALGGRLPRGGAVLSNLAAARSFRNLWAVAIRNPKLTQEQFDEDIRLAADARLRLDVRRYTTDDEMVTEVLSDVNAWIMRIVTGQAEQEAMVQDWSTVPVQFSSN